MIQKQELPVNSDFNYLIIKKSGGALSTELKNMVLSKWLRSLRYGNDYFKLMDGDSYFQAYGHYISRLLLMPDCVVRLAVLNDDKDVCLGFSVIRGMTLDYCHVHHTQRKQGIGTALVPQNISVITHLTKTGMAIWRNKMYHAVFNPWK